MKTITTIFMAFIANFTLQAQSLDDGMDATVQADSVSQATVQADSVSQATVQADFVSLPSDSLPWPDNVKARLENIISSSPLLSTSNIGVMVYDLTADSTIFRYNERKTLRPASTMKLITAITAIDRLGGSYQFRTSLRYTGSITDNVLTGDVYCVGGFDPRFNSDDMKAFVEGIRSLGVDTIRGYLVADKMMKNDDRLGWGWCWDDDNPVLSPLLISRKDDFMEKFVSELVDAGIVIQGNVIEGDTPSDAYELVDRTHSIDQILMRMMKDSDNLYAESLFYQLAASSGNRPCTAQNARNLIKRLVRKLGLNPSDYVFADGSGLSLYNYVTAELEVEMLKYAYRNSNVYLHLYPSLPIAGSDGTLKRRMRNAFTADNVRAKTGTLSGVQSLAGYCSTPNNHTLCFAIINNGSLKDSPARALQNEICTELCRP
ncbi:MAG: D-alanyl-D-alanine carboxypeptidase/D-alanyl-D-alanine-endopeptidase [Prevotellaceae bacterium]|nr:D-alanyl-D-alanine carboxypeptidase/D-alanyl-D-alanine-endopeptidase [Prevotellaceae bacterium]MDY5208833.1 D-alanyl-D-alanine carboxypeptidase/D-alanyl-D-alanine-endopeptidase [Prevotella sp.]